MYNASLLTTGHFYRPPCERVLRAQLKETRVEKVHYRWHYGNRRVALFSFFLPRHHRKRNQRHIFCGHEPTYGNLVESRRSITQTIKLYKCIFVRALTTFDVSITLAIIIERVPRCSKIVDTRRTLVCREWCMKQIDRDDMSPALSVIVIAATLQSSRRGCMNKIWIKSGLLMFIMDWNIRREWNEWRLASASAVNLESPCHCTSAMRRLIFFFITELN